MMLPRCDDKSSPNNASLSCWRMVRSELEVEADGVPNGGGDTAWRGDAEGYSGGGLKCGGGGGLDVMDPDR